MRIYFCDGCNESIPLADIQAGQVTTIKGKLFCRNCIPPGAAGSPAAVDPLPRRTSQPLLWVLLLAVGGYLLWRDLPRIGDGAGGQAETRAELAGTEEGARLEGLAAELRGTARDRDELRRDVAFLRGDVDGLRSESADLSRRIDHVQERVEGLVRSQAETGSLIEKLNFQENRAQVLESRIDGLADLVAAQSQRLTLGLAERSQATASEAEPLPAADLTQQADLAEIRRQLLDGDAGRRFGAVDRVAKGRHKSLAPDLVPMLTDEDDFVRILVMDVLGDFAYAEAVPALFNVLDDPSAAIRKQAAQTLVRLTAHDPGYDPRATKSEREKAVKRWRDWYAGRS